MKCRCSGLFDHMCRSVTVQSRRRYTYTVFDSIHTDIGSTHTAHTSLGSTDIVAVLPINMSAQPIRLPAIHIQLSAQLIQLSVLPKQQSAVHIHLSVLPIQLSALPVHLSALPIHLSALPIPFSATLSSV